MSWVALALPDLLCKVTVTENVVGALSFRSNSIERPSGVRARSNDLLSWVRTTTRSSQSSKVALDALRLPG